MLYLYCGPTSMTMVCTDVVMLGNRPYGLVVVCKDLDEMLEALESLQGQLTATIWGVEAAMLRPVLFEKSSGWQQD